MDSFKESAFKIQLLCQLSIKRLRRFQNFSGCFSNMSPKKRLPKTQQKLLYTYCVGNGFSIPQHFLTLLFLPNSITQFTHNTLELVKWKTIFLLLIALFCLLCVSLSQCPCHSRRTHSPMLEKPSAQNVTACKNFLFLCVGGGGDFIGAGSHNFEVKIKNAKYQYKCLE